MRVFVKVVDKDCVLFSVDGHSVWGHLKKRKDCYLITDLNGKAIVKVPTYYGKKLEEYINKKVAPWL